MAYVGEQVALLPAIPVAVIGGVVGMGQGLFEAIYNEDDSVIIPMAYSKEEESVEVRFRHPAGSAPGYKPPIY
jgi:hypothetical protein